MSFAVTIVDADHRPAVFAEIELDGVLVAEAFAEGRRMRVAFVDRDGEMLWETDVDELRDALQRARDALVQMALVD